MAKVESDALIGERPTVSSRQSHRSSSAPPVEHLKFWVPFYLRRWTLLVFALIYGILGIALAILFGYSQRNSGVSTARSHEHYLWTYGPTAVFTLIAFFWSQTAYRAKQLQPWVQMRKGFQPASQSVLLDYISPMNALALLRSLRHRHLLATLGIAGTLLLTAVTVLSTGLFVLQSVDVPNRNAPFDITEKFAVADSAFWSKQTEQGYNSAHADFRPTTSKSNEMLEPS